MGVGCGMYLMAGACTFLVLFCLEVLNAYSIKFGQKEVAIVFSSEDEIALLDAVESLGKQAGNFNLYRENGLYKVALDLRVSKKESALDLMKRLRKIPGVLLESME